MRFASVGKITLTAAVAGLCLPILCYGIVYLLGIPFSGWTLVIWPSSIMLLAIFRPGERVTVVPISILVNVVLYSVIGLLLGFAVSWSRDGPE